MPYYIEKNNPECKSGWAVTGAGGMVHGCHTTKKSAIKQAVAISLSTKEPFKGERAGIDTLAIGDYVSWNVLDPEILAQIVAVEGEMAVVQIYEQEEGIFTATDKLMIINIFKIERIPRPEMVAQEFEPMDQAPAPDPVAPADQAPADSVDTIDPSMESMSMDEVVTESRDKWIRAAWTIKNKLEGTTEEARSFGAKETRTEHVELRATGDGMTFEGYAAVFNSDSHPLPFIERIAPGAFRRSLQGRHRMMLLWNHDSSQPLASTRNGSLKLTEDNHGLKVTAQLANTQLGRDVAELIRSGTIDAMSFGFQVKKDSWSSDGQTRTLEEVALSEVSLVSYPAYEGTSGSTTVREMREISADKLAEGMFKLESGEELDSEESAVLMEVINKLSKTEEVQEVDGDILALKKKKLDLLMMEAL